MGGRLTTHVLDLSRGIPAAGMLIELRRFSELGEAALIVSVVTNSDGRTESPLLAGDLLLEGEYELLFAVGAYYRSDPIIQLESLFLDRVPVRFHIENSQMAYHVPLLVAPGGYSTYRGS
ncbi:hydroxyisourate hydrolase [Paenibacillus psychroresistens]|uniref:5-hydroxyisourate hydrolase n=1 Tax=Paenibacillus psychroresistens TaxID=1778678 RepID=A0A6B8RL77_9BACL|nr:hydroxyisourate hydrolase [Paenibacillus psychroresistens]QGQ97141.1 hydroxyisourate hydrolase [Paenibacillus psychroresistens]